MALTLPTGGIISGTSALIELDGWTWEDMTVKSPVGMHLFWPAMTISPPSYYRRATEEQQKKKREEALKKIKQTFGDARAYMKAKEADVSKKTVYHETDLRWEALIPVLKKELPVFVHADDIHRIQAAIDWAISEDIKMVLVGGYDSWRVAERLKENEIPVIIGGIHRTPERRWEDYDMPFKLPAKLHEAGVKFCIATGKSFGSAHERNLPYHAATAAAYGLSKQEALKSITLYPAEILGVSDRVGSLEIGKDATLIVTDGDPLEITTQVKMEFISGRNIDLTSRHTQLYQKYKTKYQQLKDNEQMTSK
jgi:imidazolonepropionase-like amidohydrolase